MRRCSSRIDPRAHAFHLAPTRALPTSLAIVLVTVAALRLFRPVFIQQRAARGHDERARGDQLCPLDIDAERFGGSPASAELQHIGPRSDITASRRPVPGPFGIQPGAKRHSRPRRAEPEPEHE